MSPMSHRILILQGHPDTTHAHLCHQLARAYADGARSHGHEVRTVDVGQLDFPLLRSAHAWHDEPLPQGLQDAQDALAWAQHIVIFFPLWLGGMPALLKGFLEQVARPGFALEAPKKKGEMMHKLLTGRSARLVVTMGMPALVYRWYFRAHSVKALERNILGFIGIAPIHETLVGSVDALGANGVDKWVAKLRALGEKAQ